MHQPAEDESNEEGHDIESHHNHGNRFTRQCRLLLALDVESVTGEHIGVNTLKRLLGFIDDEREPRISTLDVIARYLGFENWEMLKIFDDRSNSSFESSAKEVRVTDLSVGQCVKQYTHAKI